MACTVGFTTISSSADAEGRVVRWYTLATDIDKRKRAEAELEEAFEEIKRLKDRLHDEKRGPQGANRSGLYV